MEVLFSPHGYWYLFISSQNVLLAELNIDTDNALLQDAVAEKTRAGKVSRG